MAIRRSFFTILEILVVIFIIGISTVGIGFKIREAYEEQRFLTEVDQVLGHLRLAQNLSIILDTNVYFKVKLNESEDVIEAWIQSEKPLQSDLTKKKNSSFAKAFDKIKLYGVKGITFDPKPPSEDNELSLVFNRGKGSTGIMKITPYSDNNDSGKDVFVIEIKGYPHPIESRLASSENSNEGEENSQNESEKLYPVVEEKR